MQTGRDAEVEGDCGWLAGGNGDLFGIEKYDGRLWSSARRVIEERSLALGKCNSYREGCGDDD
jgi:hypothetical protein